jgi:hypothetical protein
MLQLQVAGVSGGGVNTQQKRGIMEGIPCRMCSLVSCKVPVVAERMCNMFYGCTLPQHMLSCPLVQRKYDTYLPPHSPRPAGFHLAPVFVGQAQWLSLSQRFVAFAIVLSDFSDF